METPRFSKYCATLVDPLNHVTDIPDTDMTACIKKPVTLTKNVVVPSTPTSGEILAVWLPENKTNNLWLFVWVTAQNRYVFFQIVQIDQNLSSSFTRGRLISSILKVMSSTISSTSSAISGTINSIAYQEIPAISTLTYTSLAPYVRDGKSMLINQSVQEGVVALSQPTGSQPFEVFDNGFAYSTDSELVIVSNPITDPAAWVTAPIAMAVGPTYVVYDSNNSINLPIPANVFGYKKATVLVGYTATVAAFVTFIVEYRYLQVGGDWVTVTNVLNTVAQATVLSSPGITFNTVLLPIPNTSGYLEQVQVLAYTNIATTITVQTLNNATYIETCYSNYYFNGVNSPGVLVATQGLGPNQVLSFAGKLNYEAVPDAQLALNVNTEGPSVDTTNPFEMFMVQKFLSSPQSPWKLVWGEREYEYFIQTRFHEITDLNTIAKSAGFGDILALLRPALPIVGGILGGPGGAALGTALGEIGGQLFNTEGKTAVYQLKSLNNFPMRGGTTTVFGSTRAHHHRGNTSVYSSKIVGNTSARSGRTGDFVRIEESSDDDAEIGNEEDVDMEDLFKKKGLARKLVKTKRKLGLAIATGQADRNVNQNPIVNDQASEGIVRGHCSDFPCSRRLPINISAKSCAYSECPKFKKGAQAYCSEACYHADGLIPYIEEEPALMSYDATINIKSEKKGKCALLFRGKYLEQIYYDGYSLGEAITFASLKTEDPKELRDKLLNAQVVRAIKGQSNSSMSEEAGNMFPIAGDDGKAYLGFVFKTARPLALNVKGAAVYREMFVDGTGQKVFIGFQSPTNSDVRIEEMMTDEFMGVMDLGRELMESGLFITFYSIIPFDGFSFMAAGLSTVAGFTLSCPLTGAFDQSGDGLLPDMVEVKAKVGRIYVTGSPRDLELMPAGEAAAAEVIGELLTKGMIVFLGNSSVLQGMSLTLAEPAVLKAAEKALGVLMGAKEPAWSVDKTIMELAKHDISEVTILDQGGQEKRIALRPLLTFWTSGVDALTEAKRLRAADSLAVGEKKYGEELRSALEAENPGKAEKILSTLANLMESVEGMPEVSKKKGKTKIEMFDFPDSFTVGEGEDAVEWTLDEVETEYDEMKKRPKTFLQTQTDIMKNLKLKFDALKKEYQDGQNIPDPGKRKSAYLTWVAHGKQLMKIMNTIDSAYDAYQERIKRREKAEAEKGTGKSKSKKKPGNKSKIIELEEEEEEGF